MEDTYTILRHFADSWMLLALFCFFGGACLWAFRPGSRAVHDDASRAIFRHDAPESDDTPGCAKACPDCRCANPSEGQK
ncbi:cbb3-type cytochrome c oxidase subunit 3 [Palleronia sediminis]|uniref:Cbb3-type cytochrome c oxidase subunit 3 n=1 Tax=Palleronia sediminis TaxID=2547833 RepID=A0A4R6ABG3_9RHOB|nr:cbb3-type cytochrome c oxidase subunit 3 [Palleronia sediminis]TDL79658.1 cbb3-type cytochrome c oxidase subunit 3 [Palleronia sediminis]